MLTLVSITLFIHVERYWMENILTVLWPYTLKSASGQLNNLRVEGDRVTPIKIFLDRMKYINLKHQYTWVCSVFVLNAWIKN